MALMGYTAAHEHGGECAAGERANSQGPAATSELGSGSASGWDPLWLARPCPFVSRPSSVHLRAPSPAPITGLHRGMHTSGECARRGEQPGLLSCQRVHSGVQPLLPDLEAITVSVSATGPATTQIPAATSVHSTGSAAPSVCPGPSSSPCSPVSLPQCSQGPHRG